MPAKLAKPRLAAKSADFRIRNPKGQIGNRISVVMQAVRGALHREKPAQQLAFLIDEPLGNCQKLLCGARHENAQQLAKLLRSELGREVLFALMGEDRPEWFVKYRKQLDLNDARRKLIDSQRAIEAIQAEIV